MIDTVTPSPVQREPDRGALDAPLREPLRFLTTSAPWRGLAYFTVSMVIGWVLFFLYAVIVLLPFAPAWSYGLAKLERRRVAWLGAPEIGDPHPPVSGTLSARAGARLGERATWREVAYSLLLAVLTPIVFLGACLGWVIGLGLVVAPFLDEQVTVMGATVDGVVSQAFWGAVGAVLCAVALYITYAVAALQAAGARLLLSPTEEELLRRVDVLEASRGVLVNSFEGERRRIERNLHDGPQQDLASLSLQLGELQQSLAANSSDETLGEQVAEAQARLERAMSGLRDTVRGVHPQVLDDAGVEAACAELGGAIRVDVIAGDGWERGRRLPAEMEQAMYYTASEAVTNAIKHGGAQQVWITFAAGVLGVSMTVMDDGAGGADPARGTGLAGLVERAEAIGATLTILSPPGGPTTLYWAKAVS
ncbi:histidine kinase [Tsukamurella pulmonis]|uniref:histidine kinase n=1 Tax=Tsukamurella pulmonis TaxID=47312 RepID=A0A1H1GXC0_9ACTN|nr:sensor domain-containing protein [Tsukamurella pulmonis]KXO88187.1 histidine kinase [Tsukamurella pulmonis]SDR17875.1 Signal transduction histidine kinase [Tsukamurella pulmonis]SUP16401.1 Oxygen sensor histidine kinase nreB [Tsukamurella pulmonis]